MESDRRKEPAGFIWSSNVFKPAHDNIVRLQQNVSDFFTHPYIIMNLSIKVYQGKYNYWTCFVLFL
jgi:hypothetical protein